MAWIQVVSWVAKAVAVTLSARNAEKHFRDKLDSQENEIISLKMEIEKKQNIEILRDRILISKEGIDATLKIKRAELMSLMKISNELDIEKFRHIVSIDGLNEEIAELKKISKELLKELNEASTKIEKSEDEENTYKAKLKELIGKSYVENVFEILLKCSIGSKNKNTIRLLESRYNSLKEQVRMGLITRSYNDVEINKIIYSLLNIIDDLSNDFEY